ncbi:MAG: hypothetical protein WC466_10000 [Candidatus Izemoplasmatales bacterium]
MSKRIKISFKEIMGGKFQIIHPMLIAKTNLRVKEELKKRTREKIRNRSKKI